MRVKPYQLKLKKVSKLESEIERALYSMLPRTGLPEKVCSAISDEIHKRTNAVAEISLKSWQTKSFGNIVDTLPITMLSIIVNVAPIEYPAILLIDRSLTMQIVESTLGGDGKNSSKKVLSETEKGILEYILVSILKTIKETTNDENNLNTQLENILDDPRNLRSYAKPEESYVELQLSFKWKDESSIMKLLLPNPIINEFKIASSSSNLSLKEVQERNRKDLIRYGYVTTQMEAIAGSVEINALDLDQLEEGDVILFDETKAQIKGDGLSGTITLKIKNGDSSWDASAELKPGHIKCKII